VEGLEENVETSLGEQDHLLSSLVMFWLKNWNNGSMKFN